ncbi:threonine-phosphate decarboxylase [Natrarchaeobius oligotrophus]|uniref:Aminotransferase n=1 Tax=Natrarchaeobius chitinivorans TaxID=1679083 RepID=A0A3N6MC92_NATCH|nr:threonine-phosphate decarboxylase [Natrarchaeobius chitinivorans]RQH01439.1 pyridoxal phosphate-dependent class II aminotransferase [Natrarchaeobius chitinivorans]
MDPDSMRTGVRVPHGGDPDPTVLDFSANTNPDAPAGVEAVYERALEESRRYPDDEYPAFRAAAAEFVGCDRASVIPAPGGLAAIRLATEFSLEPGDEAVVPYPSFGEYAREVRLQGAKPRFVRYDDVCDLGPSVLEAASLAIVCTPNNPTGDAVALDDLEGLADRCATAGTTLLVDEAFLGFTDLPSAVGLERENVIVARSLTKLFGLPGLRAGFAVACGEQREALETARRSWSLGVPAARVGAYCLRRDEFVRETRERTARERDRLREALERRFDVHSADAPYLLCGVGEDDDRTVESVLEEASREGIVVRDARTFRGLDSHIRVAVKDREANDRLLAALNVSDSKASEEGE